MKKPQHSLSVSFPKKTNKFFLFIALGIISVFCLRCGPSTPPPPTPPPVTTVTTDTACGLSDNNFWCLRVDKDTVLRWIAKTGSNNKFKKITFAYFWPDRSKPYFTLISSRGKNASNDFDANTDTLSKDAFCSVPGLGSSVILSGNQVSIAEIKRLWSFATDPTINYYLKFSPKINVGVDQNGNPCNCPNTLVYEINLVPTPSSGGSAYQPGSTNPSPPKPPVP